MNDNPDNEDNVIRDVSFGPGVGPCPKCGSIRTVPIVFGLPNETGMDKARRGDIHLGGCLVSGNDPEFICKECRETW